MAITNFRRGEHAFAHLHALGGQELRRTVDEGKIRRRKLLNAVVGEFLDQAPLAGDDSGQIRRSGANLNAQFRCVLGMIESVGGCKYRLAGHAAAQDAQAAQRPLLGYRYAGALFGGRARGSVSGAAAAKNDQVETFIQSSATLL